MIVDDKSSGNVLVLLTAAGPGRDQRRVEVERDGDTATTTAMFPRGPRFNPQKDNDVPGPNTYNPQEPQLDTYKRGAFLEKTDRFAEALPLVSDVPVPESNNDHSKKPKPPKGNAQPSNISDRYALLQKKVQDLEQLHVEGKKSHQAEVTRLKNELARVQKLNIEYTERFEKQRKQKDGLDIRIQDLKKAALADQTEVKDLKQKLRSLDNERTQLSTKQGEAAELKKALQALESKRRDEIKERDRRIADLEKCVGVEKRKRESAEGQLQDMHGKANDETLEALAAAKRLQTQVEDAQEEAHHAHEQLTDLQHLSTTKSEQMLSQLEQYQTTLTLVAEEYSRLASTTIPISIHSRVKHEHAVLQLHSSRLERKLSNSQEQVVELANLVRYTKEVNAILTARLRDAEEEARFYAQTLSETSAVPELFYNHTLDDLALDIEQEFHEAKVQIQQIHDATEPLFTDLYRLTCGELLFHYSIIDKELSNEHKLVEQHAADLSKAIVARESLATQVQTIQAEHAAVLAQLSTNAASLEESRLSLITSEQKIASAELKLQSEINKNQEHLKKERDTVNRLTGVIQKNQMAEDALRADIEQLTTELTDTERYQEAYYNLVDEVGALVARNALAEDEAAKLSKFNAEILGHNNPAQRIMYVDRIRRELADTKHQLLVSTREQDAVIAENEELRHELGMYKSVMVPADNKPRTNITRIGRPVLASLNQSLNVSHSAGKSSVNGGSGEKIKAQRVHVLEAIPGDMTLDEIL